ncbi:MAG: potassium channel family protein [Alcanivoracaceae bacterium]|nr:potassium channel family protein [Alcanivoracaceae bacterium]
MTSLYLSDIHFHAILITALCTIATVLAHYETLIALIKRGRLFSNYGRRHILTLVFGLLASHLVGMAIFGVGVFALLQFPEAGFLMGAQDQSLMECIYFAAISYSTLGYGDVTPQGPVRLIASITSLTGFMMITWSASATFLEMQRRW